MILWFIAGNLFSDSNGNSKDTPAISVIIAIRNGEKSLPNLIEDLSAQDYLGEVEFILVFVGQGISDAIFKIGRASCRERV